MREFLYKNINYTINKSIFLRKWISTEDFNSKISFTCIQRGMIMDIKFKSVFKFNRIVFQTHGFRGFIFVKGTCCKSKINCIKVFMNRMIQKILNLSIYFLNNCKHQNNF